MTKGYLILEDKNVFEGIRYDSIGNEPIGELVFNTAMTGYLESISDPSYYGQMLIQTFPLIGNYGVIPEDFESNDVYLKAYIINKLCDLPSNFRSEGKLGDYLLKKQVPVLLLKDTRTLTKIVREHGVMNAMISADPHPTYEKLEKIKKYKIENAVDKVTVTEIHTYDLSTDMSAAGPQSYIRPTTNTTDSDSSISDSLISASSIYKSDDHKSYDKEQKKYESSGHETAIRGSSADKSQIYKASEHETTIHGSSADESQIYEASGHETAIRGSSADKLQIYKASEKKVVLMDFGTKANIIRELRRRGCRVTTVPASTKSQIITELKPDGILLSNGPGDPAENTEIIEEIRKLTETGIPVFGICLGHQLLALANGGKTQKMAYGHRGANQPVMDMQTERVYITSQNHGYCVDENTLPENAVPLFTNVNDGTSEGIKYSNFPGFSVQFHPEACGGPLDANYLFDDFMRLMEEVNVNA